MGFANWKYFTQIYFKSKSGDIYHKYHKHPHPERAELQPLDSWISSQSSLHWSATSHQPADDMLLWSGSGLKLDYAASPQRSSRIFDYTHTLLLPPFPPSTTPVQGTQCQAVPHFGVWPSTSQCVPICQPFTWLLWESSDKSGSARPAGNQRLPLVLCRWTER